jgi:NAD(P)H-dependent flavin oxidoreductase YrpB (nitropropane dioxygenase family)
MARPTLKTPLCERLGIEYPIILAGMGAGNEGGAAGPDLVAAVSEAGGLGVLGGTGRGEEELHAAVAKIRSLTKRPFGIDVLLPAGGALGPRGNDNGQRPKLDAAYTQWSDSVISQMGLQEPSEDEAERSTNRWTSEEQVEAIIREKPAVFAAGLGSPGPYVKDLHAAGITVFGLVGNVKNAVRVRNDGADVIVAQGHEAGGHTGRIGTLALVPQVVDAVSPTPVVLAGGVGDGRGIAAAFALGAQAVWCGTAFLATNEANITDAHKQHLLASTEEDTRVTRMYSGKTARALNNPIVESWESSGLKALPMGVQGVLSGRISAAARASDRQDLNMHLGGQIGGMMHEIRPARVVLESMVAEAIEVLRELMSSRVTYSFA